MSDNKISVIIPVYNSEKYLVRCIESIINQTYKNLEIILVDDGSPDKCGKICDEYADRDERINVIHQENKGISAARNAGLDAVSGEYIAFIDSDDYVDREYINTLYNNIFDSDIVIAGYISIKENGRIIKNTNFTDKIRTILIPEDLHLLLHKCEVWGQLIRKSIIGNTRFDKRYSVGEDVVFIHTVYRKCCTIKLIPDKLYNYAVNDNSAYHGEFNKNKYTELFARQRVHEMYMDMPTLYNYWQVDYLNICLMIYNNMYNSGWKETKEAEYVIKEIRERFRYIHKVKNIKIKISLYLLALSQPLYNLFLRNRLNKKGD